MTTQVRAGFKLENSDSRRTTPSSIRAAASLRKSGIQDTDENSPANLHLA